MKVETRKTAAGTEYWDSKGKRTLFVPAGQEPNFEVTENPKSLIGEVDFATSDDFTTMDDINLDNMNADQLLSFAEQNNIEVPTKLKKEDTIRNHIAEHLSTDESK